MAVMDEQGVLLVVSNNLIYGGEGECPHGVLTIVGGVNVEVFAAVCGETD